jgi:hypothetical protein
MRRLLISLAMGSAATLAVYLLCAIPQYAYLLAHQPGRAPQGEVTSFPTETPFVLMLPFAGLFLIITTFFAWLGQSLLSKKRRSTPS